MALCAAIKIYKLIQTISEMEPNLIDTPSDAAYAILMLIASSVGEVTPSLTRVWRSRRSVHLQNLMLCIKGLRATLFPPSLPQLLPSRLSKPPQLQLLVISNNAANSNAPLFYQSKRWGIVVKDCVNSAISRFLQATVRSGGRFVFFSKCLLTPFSKLEITY